MMPTFADVLAAHHRLSALLAPTPLIESPLLSERTGARIFFKAENLQRIGSFKFRGASNAIACLDRERWPGGVVACSSGNHAQGVAEAARLAGLPAVIVMPRDAPALKIARTKRSGAEIVFYDRETEDRVAIARDISQTRNAAFISPYDDPDVIAGQGTVGLEIADQAQSLALALEAVLTPCGGGGLSAGIGLAIGERAPDCALYSVEPEGFDDTARSLISGERERNAALAGSICDALLLPQPGALTFALNKNQLTGGLAVSDEEVRAAIAFAFAELKLVLEPGGAVALAALLAGRYQPRGGAVVAVLSGGNVDPRLFAEIITAYA